MSREDRREVASVGVKWWCKRYQTVTLIAVQWW